MGKATPDRKQLVLKSREQFVINICQIIGFKKRWLGVLSVYPINLLYILKVLKFYFRKK